MAKKFVIAVMLLTATVLLYGGCGGSSSNDVSSDVNTIANGAWSSSSGAAEFVIDGKSYPTNISEAYFVLSNCDLAKDTGSMSYIGMLVAENTDSSEFIPSTLPCMIYPATVQTQNEGNNSWTAISEYGVSLAFSLISDDAASLTIDVPYDTTTIHVNMTLNKVKQEPEVIGINSALNGTWLTDFEEDGTVKDSGGFFLSKHDVAMGHSVWGGFVFSDTDINAGTFRIAGGSAMSMRSTIKPDRDIVLPSSTIGSTMKLRRVFGNTYYFSSAASKNVNGLSDESYGFIFMDNAESATVFLAKDFYFDLNDGEELISGFEIIPLKKRTADTVNYTSILTDSTWKFINGGGLTLSNSSTADVLTGDFLLKSGDITLTLSNCEADAAAHTANADVALNGSVENVINGTIVDVSRNSSVQLSRLGCDVWLASGSSGMGNVIILPATESKAVALLNIGNRFLLAGLMQKE